MGNKLKHIVCYSGGHSSALVAIEVFRKYGNQDLILLNHDIHHSVEHKDIKRFKKEIAEHLKTPITYANMPSVETKDQFDVVIDAQAFKVGNGTALCTHRLKTQPFEKYLKQNFEDKNCIIYYGFDANEKHRIQRRSQILGAQGYKTDFPLAFWPRTVQSTKEIGIEPPLTYAQFKHANCIGCLKAGKQHWYVVYCTRPDIWNKAKEAEDKIGYTIIKDNSLSELESLFESMKKLNVEPSEKINPMTFWAKVKKQITACDIKEPNKPCECLF
jgi:hypothetical protein